MTVKTTTRRRQATSTTARVVFDTTVDGRGGVEALCSVSEAAKHSGRRGRGERMWTEQNKGR